MSGCRSPERRCCSTARLAVHFYLASLHHLNWSCTTLLLPSRVRGIITACQGVAACDGHGYFHPAPGLPSFQPGSLFSCDFISLLERTLISPERRSLLCSVHPHASSPIAPIAASSSSSPVPHAPPLLQVGSTAVPPPCQKPLFHRHQCVCPSA